MQLVSMLSPAISGTQSITWIIAPDLLLTPILHWMGSQVKQTQLSVWRFFEIFLHKMPSSPSHSLQEQSYSFMGHNKQS